MMKKLVSILLIGLLVMSCVGDVSAQHDYYSYNCTLGDLFTTYNVMQAIGDPFWVSYDDLNKALVGCDIIHLRGLPDEEHDRSYWYTPVKIGNESKEIYHAVVANDYILFTVNPREE